MSRQYPFRVALGLNLKVNGVATEVPVGSTVADLLRRMHVEAPRVAVEVNSHVVRKARHAEHHLAEGDAVEIVAFVGGG